MRIKIGFKYVRFCTVLIIGIHSLMPLVIGETLESIDAQALVKKVETQYIGLTSHAITRMIINTESWSRELTMEFWSKGRDIFLAKILSPKKEMGTATLKIDEEIWNYLPKIDRLMKIPSSLMGDRWMGSHLTNDDLIKENKIDELYNFEIKKAVSDTVVIIGIPKPDAAVVWGKIEYQVNLDKMVPDFVRYFDEDEVLMRTMTFDRVEKVSGRWVPLRMVILPEEFPDEKTEMIYEKLEFDIELEKDRFSLSSLRRK